ncbi:MAG: SGNH/GDSL hydrolase family protein [Candidatus Binatia bacterium]|nr:SGNH/GDSL hydrolase family protein [Candidatus Binatia bacterium]
MGIRALIASYKTGAIIVVNTLLLFLALNFSLEAILGSDGARVQQFSPAERYGDIARRQYPELTDAQYEKLMSEIWRIDTFVYEPYTQFKPGAFAGEFVNVSPHGFRVGPDQGPWPPDDANYNVFIFGGSTTFNHGVTDAQTISARLQPLLEEGSQRPVRMYNFGRGYYFSTQERTLFEKLLMDGYVPDLAIFIDGLNDFYNRSGNPQFSPQLSGHLKRSIDNSLARLASGGATRFTDWARSLFLVKLVQTKLKKTNPPKPPKPPKPLPQNSLDDVIGRYLSNKRMAEAVAAEWEVETIWIWQPVPTYGFDEAYHPFTTKRRANGPHARSGPGYARMKERAKEQPLGQNFLWLAEMQRDMKEVLYVDYVHYSPKMSRLIAEQIDDRMRTRELGPYQARLVPAFHGGVAPAAPVSDRQIEHPGSSGSME